MTIWASQARPSWKRSISCRRPVAPVADHQPDEVDGHEPARAQHLGATEGEERERHGKDRVQPGSEVQAVDQPDQHEARDDPKGGAADDLVEEVEQQEPGPLPIAGHKQLDAADGQEDGHGVVDGGLDLEQAAYPWLDLEPVQMEQEEHRRRIRRADDRADQDALDPAEAEEQPRRDPGQQSGQCDADGRQQQRRPGGRAEVSELGAQPAVEQDDGERHGADGVGGEIVLEEDAARAVLAEEDAQAQERQQQRRPDPGRDQTDEDAEEQKERSQQDQMIGELHDVPGTARQAL